MKKAIVAVMVSALLLSGCASSREIDGKRYKAVGLFDYDERSPDIKYELSVGSIIVSILLFETAIFPILIIGFDLYEPMRKKDAGEK